MLPEFHGAPRLSLWVIAAQKFSTRLVRMTHYGLRDLLNRAQGSRAGDDDSPAFTRAERKVSWGVAMLFSSFARSCRL